MFGYNVVQFIVNMSISDLRIRFIAQLEKAPHRVLLLDYDGTLAPFRPARDRAFPYEGVREILRNILDARHTRLVIISGRAIKDLLPLLGMNRPPEIWGSHGWERLLPDGTYQQAPLSQEATLLLNQAAAFLRNQGWDSDSEIKPAGIALHWRGYNDAEIDNRRRHFSAWWESRPPSDEISLLEFDGGLELRPAGKDKGDAVRAILAESPAGTKVAFLGDDATDEDAFKAIAGRGLPVLVRPQFRETAAEVWLKPPEELVHFLAQWHTISLNSQMGPLGNR